MNNNISSVTVLQHLGFKLNNFQNIFVHYHLQHSIYITLGGSNWPSIQIAVGIDGPPCSLYPLSQENSISIPYCHHPMSVFISPTSTHHHDFPIFNGFMNSQVAAWKKMTSLETLNIIYSIISNISVLTISNNIHNLRQFSV